MRYLFALVFGLAGAALAARFLAPWAAPAITGGFTYESPDGEAFVEQASFIGVMLIALLLGWLIGLLLGRALEKPEKPI
ncbi:MAG: hypothetical protein RLZ98_2540 [Pseudomonadota bacterium]|jgi:hypothetical protein